MGKSQESLCTPTGQGRGATFQRRLTPPKKETEAQATLPLLLIWLRFSCLRLNSCVWGDSWQNICLELLSLDCLNALTPFVTFPNDCISSYMTTIMTDNDPTINWTVRKKKKKKGFLKKKKKKKKKKS